MQNLSNQLKILFSSAEIAIIIRNGELKSKRASIANILLDELKDLSQKHNIQHALITFDKKKAKLKLSGIPSKLEQRFRNVWASNYKG